MRNLEFREDGEPGVVTRVGTVLLLIFVASSVHAKLGEGRLLPYHLPGSIAQRISTDYWWFQALTTRIYLTQCTTLRVY